MGALTYFKEVEHAFNNGILAREDGNLVFPSQSGEIKKTSLSNSTALKFILGFRKLFDIVFLFHDDGGKRKEVFQNIVNECPMIMEKIKVLLLDDGEVGQLPCVFDDGFTGGGECDIESVYSFFDTCICGIRLPI